MEGKPFIDTVTFMGPYWLWRAIGGSLMWFSHILFTYNFYVMLRRKSDVELPKSAAEILQLKKETTINPQA